MKKLKLIIKEKGHYVKIPGMPPFRSPVEVDVTRVKVSTLLQSLHSCGVNNYELISLSKTGEVIKRWDNNDLNNKDNKNQEDEKLLKKLDKLDKLEGMLLTLLSKKESQKDNNSEQITNRLTKIEKMLRSGVSFTQRDIISSDPIVEEIEDQFIPSIDVDNMKMSGKSIEVVEKSSKDDIDDAVDLLSRLTKNGGK